MNWVGGSRNQAKVGRHVPESFNRPSQAVGHFSSPSWNRGQGQDTPRPRSKDPRHSRAGSDIFNMILTKASTDMLFSSERRKPAGKSYSDSGLGRSNEHKGKGEGKSAYSNAYFRTPVKNLDRNVPSPVKQEDLGFELQGSSKGNGPKSPLWSRFHNEKDELSIERERSVSPHESLKSFMSATNEVKYRKTPYPKRDKNQGNNSKTLYSDSVKDYRSSPTVIKATHNFAQNFETDKDTSVKVNRDTLNCSFDEQDRFVESHLNMSFFEPGPRSESVASSRTKEHFGNIESDFFNDDSDSQSEFGLNSDRNEGKFRVPIVPTVIKKAATDKRLEKPLETEFFRSESRSKFEDDNRRNPREQVLARHSDGEHSQRHKRTQFPDEGDLWQLVNNIGIYKSYAILSLFHKQM